jgi:hypothetical protein
MWCNIVDLIHRSQAYYSVGVEGYEPSIEHWAFIKPGNYLIIWVNIRVWKNMQLVNSVSMWYSGKTPMMQVAAELMVQQGENLSSL